MSTTSARRVPLVVVGAGPAGIAAAVECARQGLAPLLLDARGVAGGTIEIAHAVDDVPFVEPGCPGAEVARRLVDHLARWHVPVVRAEVVRVERRAGGLVLATAEGEPVHAERLVVATGTRAAHPGIEGLAHDFSHGLFASAPEAWAHGAPRSAAVVGGSDVAVDQARWLRSRGVEVVVLCRSESLRAPARLRAAAESEGVRVRTGVRVVRGERDRDGIRLELRSAGDSWSATVGAVVAAVGRVPNTLPGLEGMLGDAGESAIGFAGDVTGRRARHVVAALGDGCLAASALLEAARAGSERESER
jgi:thioredoxin reductase (NADPH)